MKNATQVIVAEYNTITEAEVARSILQSAGIESDIRNEYMSTVYAIGAIPAQVVVSETDYETAHEMLNNQ